MSRPTGSSCESLCCRKSPAAAVHGRCAVGMAFAGRSHGIRSLIHIIFAAQKHLGTCALSHGFGQGPLWGVRCNADCRVRFWTCGLHLTMQCTAFCTPAVPACTLPMSGLAPLLICTDCLAQSKHYTLTAGMAPRSFWAC